MSLNVQEVVMVQPAMEEPQVIVNAQPEVAITAVIEIATVAHITNDATVEISYKAPEIENVIGEQRQVYYCVENGFEKNQDIKIVDDIGSENDIHEHHFDNVSNDIEHEHKIVSETSLKVSPTHPTLSSVAIKNLAIIQVVFYFKNAEENVDNISFTRRRVAGKR